MKIIAGKYRNKLIPSFEKSSYRPSTSKLREAIFSILSSGEFIDNVVFKNSDILDIFAGTGSLSFEALSRGAKTITLIDNDRQHLRLASDFAKKLGEEENFKAIISDATNLSKSDKQYDLIFIDPPYNKKLIYRTVNSLIQNKWLKNKSIIVIEMVKNEDISMTEDISIIKTKVYGNSKLVILRYGEE